MKKVLYIILVLNILFLTGCTEKNIVREKKEEKSEIINETEKTLEEEKYQDNNTTPISFYELKGNTLIKISNINTNFQPLEDINLFQIYPSNEDKIVLSRAFSESYYETWQYYNTIHSIKIGFSLSFTRNNMEDIYYNIFSPNNTMDKWEYIMAYLYDDYDNRGKSFYSHIEPEEFTEKSLITAIKLQCGAYIQEISSPILFTVFTYDSEDDFINGQYRGNSKTTIKICSNTLPC